MVAKSRRSDIYSISDLLTPCANYYYAVVYYGYTIK